MSERKRGSPRLPPNKRASLLLATLVTAAEADLIYACSRLERQSVSDFLRDSWRDRIRRVVYPKHGWIKPADN